MSVEEELMAELDVASAVVAECELSNEPVFIDGRAVCHACGWAVRAVLLDGLWCFVPHDFDGREPTPRAAKNGRSTDG